MYCKNCGQKEVNNKANFCKNCGSKINFIDINLKKTEISSNDVASQKMLAIATWIIIIIAILFLISVNSHKSPNDKSITASSSKDNNIQTQQINKDSNALPKINNDLQTIIKEWHPRIVYLSCQFSYPNGTVYQQQSGSGTLGINTAGKVSLATNRHVITDQNSNLAFLCQIRVPFDKVYSVYINNNNVYYLNSGPDVAYIQIDDADENVKNSAINKDKMCDVLPDLGAKILIIGYPTIGSQTDVTVTDGIISGFDGNYYITDAKVDHGNSGGAAIDLKNDCYLGIPTWSESGSFESLARILKWQTFLKN